MTQGVIATMDDFVKVLCYRLFLMQPASFARVWEQL